MSHNIYAVPTDLLANRNTGEQKLAEAVKVIATKPSGNDGMICDAQGRIYTTDFEENCIRRTDPESGASQVARPGRTPHLARHVGPARK